MEFKITAIVAVLLLSGNAYAADSLGYYSIEDIHKSPEKGAKYGPYPTAMSADGTVVAAHSYLSSLSPSVDVGLPYTFNKSCQYDDEMCYFEFHGSNSEKELSYENAYKKWREDFVYDRGTQHLFSTILKSNSVISLPPELLNVDVKITAVDNDGNYVGYFNTLTNKKVRTAFYVDGTGYHKLVTDGDNKFNSAYDIKVVNEGGTDKTYIVGTGSVEQNNYHDECYGGSWDYSWTKGDLTYCPGYNTKAYYWDADAPADKGMLLGSWLSSDSDSYNATALKVNNQGIAVGVSSKNVRDEYNTNDPYNPQRAIVMDITDPNKRKELDRIMNDVGEEGLVYNTWAVSIEDAKDATDKGEIVSIVGNREFAIENGRNQATEFFITDSKNNFISIPLKNKKVMTTKHKNENPSKNGANSRAYDSAMIFKEGSTTEKELWVVGEADEYNQTDPVTDGSPRGQTAFLYQKETNKSWRINDLICAESGGKVDCPRIRVRSARVINEVGTILAEGFEYPTDEAFQYLFEGKPITFKLIRNVAVKMPDDSPNAWDSKLYEKEDAPYERSSIFWSVFFLVPLMFVRRFKTKS